MLSKTLRRIVTGHDAKGSALVASDEQINSQPFQPGWNYFDVWAAAAPLHLPQDTRPDLDGFFPPPGGFRCFIATIDPHTDEAHDPARHDQLFHRTASIDLILVVSGQCVLDIDEGVRTNLAAGDSVVQCGTVHAWRNPYDEPCRMIFMMVGAHHALLK